MPPASLNSQSPPPPPRHAHTTYYTPPEYPGDIYTTTQGNKYIKDKLSGYMIRQI